MERLEVCDENGTPTGRIETRKTIHRKGLIHRTVHVWFYRQKEILLQKRAAFKDSHPGLWDVSAAGHVDIGETPIAAAIREIKEELGIAIGEKMLQYIETKRLDLISHNGKFIDREITGIYLYHFNGAVKDLSFDRKEVQALRFMPAALLREKLGNKCEKKEYVPHGSEYYEYILSLVEGELIRRDD